MRFLFGSSLIVCPKVNPGVGPRPHDQMPDFSYAGSFRLLPSLAFIFEINKLRRCKFSDLLILDKTRGVCFNQFKGDE